MLEKIEGHLGKRGKPWTAGATLPGGDFPATGFEAQAASLKASYPFLNIGHARRLTRLYGTRAKALLGLAASTADLGQNFGADLYEVEINYLMANEWAVTAEDVLWRRTKRGLRFSKEQTAMLEQFMTAARGDRAAAE